MSNLQQRSSSARIFAFIVLLGLVPAWFFYIGIQYAKTVSILKAGGADVSEFISQN